MEWFTFKAREEVLGLDAQYVYRVVDDAKITPVPLTPECYLGLTYYRGELFTVIDIVNMLGYGRVRLGRNTPVVLVKWSDRKLALVTDEIVGLLWKEDEAGSLPTYSKGDDDIQFISPENIWNNLLKLSYGPDEIQKDLCRGV